VFNSEAKNAPDWRAHRWRRTRVPKGARLEASNFREINRKEERALPRFGESGAARKGGIHDANPHHSLQRRNNVAKTQRVFIAGECGGWNCSKCGKILGETPKPTESQAKYPCHQQL